MVEVKKISLQRYHPLHISDIKICFNTDSKKIYFPQAQLCQGRGPGKDNFESTKIIAERQFNYSLVSGTFESYIQDIKVHIWPFSNNLVHLFVCHHFAKKRYTLNQHITMVF